MKKRKVVNLIILLAVLILLAVAYFLLRNHNQAEEEAEKVKKLLKLYLSMWITSRVFPLQYQEKMKSLRKMKTHGRWKAMQIFLLRRIR